MKPFLFSLLFLFGLSSCSSEDDQTALILGSWQGVSWTIKGEDSGRNAASVKFEFKEDQSYRAIFGTQQEEGTFRLSGNQLYTTATGKAEKMVILSTISTDKLVMDMNRQGDEEQLTLSRE